LELRICIYIYDFGTRKIPYVNVSMNSLVSRVILSANRLVLLAAAQMPLNEARL
jgi:hypothetical protein